MKNFIKQVFRLNVLMNLCVVLTLSACASAGTTSTNQRGLEKIPQNKSFDPNIYDKTQADEQFVPVVKENTFNVGDTATISVNAIEEFSGIYTVGNAGNIYLSHIGDVNVLGKTTPEVQIELIRRYGSCCLVNPNVVVELEGQSFGKIVVSGAVKKSGVFDVSEVITLSQAVALAGGGSEFSDLKKTVISREINNERRVSVVDLRDIQLNGANDPLIYPNDVIFVQDSKGKLIYDRFVQTIPIVSSLIIAGSR